MNKRLLLLLACLSLAVCLPAARAGKPDQAGAKKAQANASPDIDAQQSSVMLPAAFNGWLKSERSAKTSTDPATASSTDAAVLKEYGFSDMETATYSREDRKIQIKALRFHDASGAYGAFTFYLDPEMQTAKIPDQGVANNSRILFYRGNILVQANLDRITAMSAADMRALSDVLPKIHGNLSTLPSLPRELPPQSYQSHTSRYVIGPVSLERLGVPIPASLVDFSKGAEVEFAKYRSSIGEAQLTIISYPTPHIAAERMKAIQAASLPGGPFYFKRSAPYVVIVNGDIPANEAQSLLASVNYDAEVTLNEPTKPNAKDDRVGFIIALVVLIVMMMIGALILGFVLGGIRLWVKKHYPNSIFDRPDDLEIIQLNLK